ncbi:MAG: MFS transporter [Bdellovibrionota bacterium]
MSPLLLTCLAFFIVQLDTTILYVAFPSIQASFPGSAPEHLGWVINAYTILFGSFLIPAGAYSDQFGRKRFFTIGVFIFTLASLLCGLSGTIEQLIAARAFQAIGAAMLIPSSLALVLSSIEQSKRSVAVSIWSAVGGLAAAVGPSLGAFLITTFGWRAAFFINVPIGVLIIIGTLKYLKESLNPQPITPSLLASGLLAITLIALSMCFSESGVSQHVLIWIAVTFVLATTFILLNKKIKNPALDFSLFSHRTIRFSNIGTFTFAIGFSAMFLGFVIYLTKGWSYDTLHAGLAMTPGPLLVIPTAILAGKYASRKGHKLVILLGGTFFITGLSLRMLWPADSVNFLMGWLPAMAITGIGTGLIMPSLSAAATFHLPRERYAMGSGLNNTLRQCGSVIGVATLILLTQGTAKNLNLVFSFSIICVLIATISALWIDTRPLK